MKFFCVLAACAFLLGGLVVCKDTGSPQATAAPAQSTEATPVEEMDDKVRILDAIEEAGRYADFSTGEVVVKVRTTIDSRSTIIEVRPDFIKGESTHRFLALVNADGSLTHFNQNYSLKEVDSSEAFVKALEFWLDIIETEYRKAGSTGPDANPHFWITEFTARIRNHADYTDVFLDIRPGSLIAGHGLRVKGDEVTIELGWRPNDGGGAPER